MKKAALIISGILLLAGCAPLEEAYYLDREYGQANLDARSRQVAYPDYRYAGKTPQGTEGIAAEEIMSVHNSTFGKAPEQVNVFQLDIAR
ncbi:MAG: hypothetical protein C0617_01315 [Desulfuromonas sp.]|uniref:hypothetical protein n=1 Tax=Desulfuromonas sp. TaxID=892 RepID=UPI000CB58A17|nr:hypothetical protein [Desulfuromonas sp.]PLX86250.1 MAG: hypothetical protein C0617_01315 [Desulfuromonas sp.]